MVRTFIVPEKYRVTDGIAISHFKVHFAFLPLEQLKKQKFWTVYRNTLRYHHSSYVYQKLSSGDVQLLRYGV